MKRMFTFALLAIATLAVVASSAHQAHAQRNYGWDSFWHNTGVSAKRMNHYPEPFNYADREAAREPFRIMVNNGRQLQNTLGAHYFHSETQELTQVGERKVRSIVLESPEQHRTVFVLRGMNEDVTAIRLDSVQSAVARAIPHGPLPEVLATNTQLRGTAGEYVDGTIRGAASSRPAPVLPTSGGGTN